MKEREGVLSSRFERPDGRTDDDGRTMQAGLVDGRRWLG